MWRLDRENATCLCTQLYPEHLHQDRWLKSKAGG